MIPDIYTENAYVSSQHGYELEIVRVLSGAKSHELLYRYDGRTTRLLQANREDCIHKLWDVVNAITLDTPEPDRPGVVSLGPELPEGVTGRCDSCKEKRRRIKNLERQAAYAKDAANLSLDDHKVLTDIVNSALVTRATEEPSKIPQLGYVLGNENVQLDGVRPLTYQPQIEVTEHGWEAYIIVRTLGENLDGWEIRLTDTNGDIRTLDMKWIGTAGSELGNIRYCKSHLLTFREGDVITVYPNTTETKRELLDAPHKKLIEALKNTTFDYGEILARWKEQVECLQKVNNELNEERDAAVKERDVANKAYDSLLDKHSFRVDRMVEQDETIAKLEKDLEYHKNVSNSRHTTNVDMNNRIAEIEKTAKATVANAASVCKEQSAENDKLKAMCKQTDATNTELREALKKAEDERDAYQRDCHDAEHNLSDAQAELEKEKAANAELEEKLKEAEGLAEHEQGRIAAGANDYARKELKLQKQIDGLQRELHRAHASENDYRKQVDKLTADGDKLKSELAVTHKAANTFDQDLRHIAQYAWSARQHIERGKKVDGELERHVKYIHMLANQHLDPLFQSPPTHPAHASYDPNYDREKDVKDGPKLADELASAENSE